MCGNKGDFESTVVQQFRNICEKIRSRSAREPLFRLDCYCNTVPFLQHSILKVPYTAQLLLDKAELFLDKAELLLDQVEYSVSVMQQLADMVQLLADKVR